MSKKVCISGYYGFDNFGDEGILGILVQNLRTIDANITVFSSSPKKTAEIYGVNSIKTFDIVGLLNTIENSDVLISGGGSLLQDVTSFKSLLYYLFVISVALYYKKKVIIFAQGIGPIRNLFAKLLTRLVLRNTDYISVRDEKSLFMLRGWGLSPDLVSDPMWNIELEEREPQGRVGVQLRDWKTLTDDYLLSLARNVAEYYSEKSIYIYSFQDSQDYEVCMKFKNYLELINPKLRTTLIYQRTNKEMVESFKKMDYLIAMRFHACLLAVKYGIPTLPISYDEKVEKFARELGLDYLKLDEIDKIKELVEKLRLIDMEKVNEVVALKKLDFGPIFEIINAE